MRADAGGDAEAAFMQHGGPEQCMEVENVFADEVNQFGVGIGLPVGVEIEALFFGERFEGAHIADGGIKPHVKVFARCIRDGKAEVRGIPRDVPVAEFVLTGDTQPFLHLVGGFVLQNRDAIGCATGEVAQKLLATRIRELEEVMLRRLQYGHAARNGRTRILQL